MLERILKSQMLDADGVRAMLRQACKQAGGVAAWCRESKGRPKAAYVYFVLAGRQDPGPLILAALGLEKIERYRKKQGDKL